MENINQTDIAPLISALLDIYMPANSMGRLPSSTISVSNSGLIKAMIANALQIHEQVLSYQRLYGDTVLTSEAYGGLDLPSVMGVVSEIVKLQKRFV